MKSFKFEINLCEVLSERAIWPDGNAPLHPTVEDVEALFFADADVHATARRWGFEITRGDVQVTELAEPETLAPFVEDVAQVLLRGYGATLTSRRGQRNFVDWLSIEATFQFPGGGGLHSTSVRSLLRKIQSTPEYDLLEFSANHASAVTVVQADPDLIGRLLFAEARRQFDAAGAV